MRKKDRHAEEPAAEPVSTDAPTGTVDAAALLAEIEKARAREDELLRALAELQNVSRRRKQEMETSVLYAQESLVKALLPVLDDLDRALEASKSREDDPFRAGLLLIQDRLRRTLAREGLEAIRSEGDLFDPQLHDAMAQRPTADAPPDTILEVMLPGYRLRGRVLRHAQVVVAGPPLPESPPGAGEDQP